MPSLVDYDKHYEKGRGQCGDTFPEFVAFFKSFQKQRADVLDLGCGQGRDALVAGRCGHRVVGVDLSPIGIRQMLEDAEVEGLAVEGTLADVVDYKPKRKFDVIILDRVLHLLPGDADRTAVLEKACAAAKIGGYVLIADTPKNQRLIRAFFDGRDPPWTPTKRNKSFFFAKRVAR